MDELECHERLKKKLTALRHFERCIFSAWCCDRLLSLVEIATDEVAKLQSILDEIWDVFLSGVIPEKALLNMLDEVFEESATDAFNDTNTLKRIGRNAVGILILGCRRNDVGPSIMCGEAVLEAILQPESPESAGEPFLDQPAMRQELDIQFGMIKYLRGDFVLDNQLRGTIRGDSHD